MNTSNIQKWEMEYLQNVRFSDDFMFGATLRMNPDICRRFLETLLHLDIEKIEYVNTEETRKLNLGSKGIRMDVYVKGSDKVFDIEMQTTNKPALGKRSRYYQSMMDGELLFAGEDYSALKESFVIFICLEDPFVPWNLPVYTFERRALENVEIALGDNSHIVFYNCSGMIQTMDKELYKLLSYIATNKADSAFTKEIDQMVGELKERRVGFSDYLAFKLHDSDVRREGFEEGRKEGRKEDRRAIALRMKKDGLDTALIARYTELSEEEIQAL